MLTRHTILTCMAAICLTVETGCLSDRKFMQEMRDAEKRHNDLASQPTPREWRAGAVWRFVTTPPAGKPKLAILTFRVTNKPGVSCLASSGWKDVWRKFVVLEGHVPLGSPVYQVEGRALKINLSGDMCDDYDIIDGVLTGAEFQGERRTFGLGAPGETIGTVRGSYVKQ